MKPKQIPGVPSHEKGSFHDTESVKSIENHEINLEKFQILKDRLWSVNNWNLYSEKACADFKLFDKLGNPKNQIPEIGDFIRINIPGPGNFEANGFDWVEITNLHEQQNKDSEILEFFLLECKPSPVPGSNDSHTAHFYTKEASSTFIISRGENFIKAGIYGRNESPNFDAGFADKTRNLVIAAGGMIGFSKIQWQNLTDGLVDF